MLDQTTKNEGIYLGDPKLSLLIATELRNNHVANQPNQRRP